MSDESEEGLVFGGTKTGRLKERHLRMYLRLTNLTRIVLIFETGVRYDRLAINTSAMGVRSSLYNNNNNNNNNNNKI